MNKVVHDLQTFAQVIKAVSNNVHYAHFVVNGQAFLLLHPLFEKLYTDLDKDWDTVTEKLVELFISPVNPNNTDWSDPALEFISKLYLTDTHYAPVLRYVFDSLKFMLEMAKGVADYMKSVDNLGMEDLLGTFIRKYEHWVTFTLARSYEEDEQGL